MQKYKICIPFGKIKININIDLDKEYSLTEYIMTSARSPAGMKYYNS